MSAVEYVTTSETRKIEPSALHYAGVDAPMVSLCGIRVSGPRITDYSQNDVCEECVDKMLDWIDWCRRNNRVPTGEPWAFKASDDP